MNPRDLVRRLIPWGERRDDSPAEDPSVSADGDPETVDEERVRRLVREATDDRVTEPILAGETDHTNAPPAAYLESDETVEYLLPAGRVWFGDDITLKADEVPSKETVVLVTDRRVLIIVGKRFSDSVWAVPFEGLDLANVKHGTREAYLVLDAEYQDSPQVFFVELQLPVEVERYQEITKYCNDR